MAAPVKAVEVDVPTSPAPKTPAPNAKSPSTPTELPVATGRGLHTLQSVFSHKKPSILIPENDIGPEVPGKPFTWLNVRNVKGLDFLSPQLLRPHGLAGIVSVLLGLYFTARTLLGYHVTPGPPNGLITLYAVCGTIACLGALGLIKKAPSSARLFFQMGALLQIGMLYFTYRFDSFPCFVHASVPGVVAHGVDVVMAGLMLSTVLVLLKATIMDTSNVYASTGLKIATCCGIFAIGSLTGYPCQLAIYGDAWLRKVYRWYPLQQVAFPYYVYIPATMGFNVIFFSATLHIRKLVSTKTFVYIILGFVFGTLVPTVVLQEIFIPKVSTQKLLIFSPPVATRWWPRFDL